MNNEGVCEDLVKKVQEAHDVWDRDSQPGLATVGRVSFICLLLFWARVQK